MKKIFTALIEQRWTLLGMLAAWVVLEGSARTFVTYGILCVTVLDVVYNVTKGDDND